jgi:hypothetical protein
MTSARRLWSTSKNARPPMQHQDPSIIRMAPLGSLTYRRCRPLLSSSAYRASVTGDLCATAATHTLLMEPSHRLARRLVLAGTLVVVLIVGGITASWAAWKVADRRLGATTQVIDRSDERFDVLVQRRLEGLDTAGGQLTRPEGAPRLTPAQAFSIAHGQRQPDGSKPSVRLATFSDADFPTPVGLDGRLVSRARRALVWVVVVPDVPPWSSVPTSAPNVNSSDARAIPRLMRQPGSHSAPGSTVDSTYATFR